MYKFITSATTILLVVISSCLPVQGASRKLPNSSEVQDALEISGKPHSEVGRIKRLDSLKMEDTYFHVFYGKSDDGSYRVILFNNAEQYLGFYNTRDFEPVKINGDGDGMAYEVVLMKEDAKSGATWYTRIPFGNKGPWESIRTRSRTDGTKRKATVFRITPVAAYSPPPVTTAVRKWTMKSGYEFQGSLAMLTESFIYVQTPDGCIETWNRPFISYEDEKYIKTIKNTL